MMIAAITLVLVILPTTLMVRIKRENHPETLTEFNKGYHMLITVHPVQHLYIGSEVVIIFDDVRIPYIVKAEPVAESGSGIVAKAISQASDSRRRLRC